MVMYSLTYLYEGVDDCSPYATTIAVSDDPNKLHKKMYECVEQDQFEPDDDDECWDDCHNYNVIKTYENEVVLQHRKRINLYAKYSINQVEQL